MLHAVRYTAARMSVPIRWRSAALVSVVVWSVACAAPPTKELTLAQGALDAARAAGAAEYAAEDLAGAEQTLSRAHADVTAGDYRAALGHALDAHARAQAAARAAADGRVRARLAADETLDEFARRIERVETALASDEAKRVPVPIRQRVQEAVTHALATLATSRTAVERGDRDPVAAIRAEIAALDAALTTLTSAPPVRPRGRR